MSTPHTIVDELDLFEQPCTDCERLPSVGTVSRVVGIDAIRRQLRHPRMLDSAPDG